MARFKFRLQSVLEHKRRLEDVAQAALLQQQAAQRQEEAALRHLADAEVGAVRELERYRRTGRLEMEPLQLSLGYLQVMKTRVQSQAQAVERAQHQTVAKREQLAGCVKDRKAMEQLRERQLGAFTLEQNRAEARQIDDLMIGRFGHEQAAARAGRR